MELWKGGEAKVWIVMKIGTSVQYKPKDCGLGEGELKI